jgi:hypothetical protein
MTYSRIVTIFTASALCLALSAADVAAQRRGGGGGGGGRPSGGGGGGRPPGGGAVTGRAVPRPPIHSGRAVVAGPYGGVRYGGARYGYGYAYRPYYYGYGYRPYYYPYSGFGFGFYASFGYPYGYYGSPYRYGYPYAYPYPYYGGYYGYPVAPAGYYNAGPAAASGGVRINGAPHDAQVFVDGYYVGIVDDFDGAFQQLNLEAGAHELEIRIAGRPPSKYDVNVQPGLTMTIHAGFQ